MDVYDSKMLFRWQAIASKQASRQAYQHIQGSTGTLLPLPLNLWAYYDCIDGLNVIACGLGNHSAASVLWKHGRQDECWAGSLAGAS
jgi:hypothetical protein